MLLKAGNTLNQINSELNKLSDEEQKLLLIKLKKGELLPKAKVINSRVKKSGIKTSEIVSTINKSRKRNAG